MTTPATILIVDDEPGVRQVLGVLLRTAGYEAIDAASGIECLHLAYERHPDLVLLDIMMPDRDGREVCRRLREISNVPIIMLTALSEEREKVDRLTDGADDYVTKPFENAELLARVRAVLRRSGRKDNPGLGTYRDDYLTIDFEGRRLIVDGEEVTLSPKQWRLLECLVARKNRVVPRADLLRYTWGEGYDSEQTYLKVLISHLRRKLNDPARHPRYIRTERDLGYLFKGRA